MNTVLHAAPPQGLLLDLDGTLVDTRGDFQQALQRMLAQLPAPYASFVVELEQVEHLVGKGTEHLVRSLLAQVQRSHGLHTLEESMVQQALQAYMAHYPHINGHYSTVYAGVQAGLQRCQQQGLPMACVTNKPERFARDLLQAKGLLGYFQLVVGGDTVARKKPDPMPLLHACSTLGWAPARTWMVGDSSNDVVAARAAGCPVLLVPYGYNHGESVQSAGADAYIDTLEQLPLAAP
ncbi:phosphoglycolate phosphatase [Curvibacter sp. CHRR-16]|uniref:phosphoglycolate phosphatase n=1 Tax=Curvibacter sp. CHRR-16 TaxID=2835872 RepID=UPI0032E9C552